MSEQVYVVQLPEEERRAALEDLSNFLLRYFRFMTTEHPGWHKVDAQTCEHLQGMIERFRSLEEKANASHD